MLTRRQCRRPRFTTVKQGFQSAVRYDHYSTARTIEEALGLAPLTDNARFATPFNDVFIPEIGPLR